MTTTLSESEVVRRLMVRLGCEFRVVKGVRFERWFNPEGCIVRPIDLKSHDSVQPVLAKLTDEEWHSLHGKLTQMCNDKPFWSFKTTQWLLTLPPRTLAFAIAEVLGGALTPVESDTRTYHPVNL